MPIDEIFPGTSGSEPNGFCVYDGKLYFSANDGSGRKLWALWYE